MSITKNHTVIWALAAVLLTATASAADWQAAYDALSSDARAALHVDRDAYGDLVGSRYDWIRDVEKYQRPVLQTDEELWRQVDIRSTALGLDEVQRQSMFNDLRRYTDTRNEEVDRTIAALFADETGDYRRQLMEDGERITRRVDAEIKLGRLRHSTVRGIRETQGDEAAEAAFRRMLSEPRPVGDER